MSIAEEGSTGSFVYSTRFDTDETVFDNIDAADAVGSGDFVGVHEEFEGVSLMRRRVELVDMY